jgi:hypothetical protein
VTGHRPGVEWWGEGGVMLARCELRRLAVRFGWILGVRKVIDLVDIDGRGK